jgi:hypothetical protein
MKFTWAGLLLLLAGLSLGMVAYIFALDFIARWIPFDIAFWLPGPLVWLTVFAFVYRRRHVDESTTVVRTRLAVIPVIAVPIVWFIGFSLAIGIGGLWVQMKRKTRPSGRPPASVRTSSREAGKTRSDPVILLKYGQLLQPDRDAEVIQSAGAGHCEPMHPKNRARDRNELL